MDGPRNDAWPYGVKDPGRMFVSQVSAGEKGRPKAVAGWIEIAAGDKDARRRAVWLTEKGALSLEAGLADWKRAHSELAKRPAIGSGGGGARGELGARRSESGFSRFRLAHALAGRVFLAWR